MIHPSRSTANYGLTISELFTYCDIEDGEQVDVYLASGMLLTIWRHMAPAYHGQTPYGEIFASPEFPVYSIMVGVRIDDHVWIPMTADKALPENSISYLISDQGGIIDVLDIHPAPY